MDNAQDVDTGEAAALTELVKSEGWKRFLNYIDTEWGSEACIQKIDRALATAEAGNSEAQHETVLQIRAAARQIQRLTAWPDEQIKRLRKPKPARTNFLGRRIGG